MFSIANTIPHQCIIDEAKPPAGPSFYIVKCSCGWVFYDSSVESEYNTHRIFQDAESARIGYLCGHLIPLPIKEWAIVNEFE